MNQYDVLDAPQGIDAEEKRKTATSCVRRITADLNAKNWDFHDETVRLPIHYIHPYPAKFIGALPRELISLLHPGDDGYVLDPFCGCGTTLVEAALAGLPSIGIDLHPLATLITKVKTTPLAHSIAPVAHGLVARARNKLGKYQVPEIPNVDHWFSKEIQQALAGLIEEINSYPSADARDALKIALSSIIVRVSRQESDTRYAAIDKDTNAEATFDLFMRASQRVDLALMGAYGSLFTKEAKTRVITKDILKVDAADIPEKISLIVTSPPYPNAYEYWLYHKYRMYWLGMDPIAVRSREIGARPHYHTTKNPQTAEDFARQMGQCFNLFYRILGSSGFVCLIVGRSIIHGKTIDNSALINEVAKKEGFVAIAQVARAIPKYKKAFNPKTSQINSEDLLIFSK